MRVTSSIWSIPIQQLVDVVQNSISLSEVMRKLNYSDNTGARRTMKRRILSEGINTTHFRHHYKGKPSFNKKDINEYLKEGIIVKSSDLKKKLLREGLLKEECAICGLSNMWNNKPIILQLDHINGDSKDNRLENLRILCPNCHSQTETFGAKKLKVIYFCKVCNKQISKWCKTSQCSTCIKNVRKENLTYHAQN